MSDKKAKIWQENMVIPTYELGEEERLPIFFKLRNNQGTRGDIYPYKNKDSLTLARNDAHTYKAIRMENDYIRVTVLPELGGRIYEGYDKANDYNFVYRNNVIKPALIGLNGAWISGGIEFNWPQHHRPTTFMPVESRIEEEEDGSVTAWVGETESLSGQKCALGIGIRPDSSCIHARVRLYNPTPQKEPFHWWSNLAVHVNDSYRLMFPPDIDYITFHDKTHVSPFPVVKGIFAGADYADGVDIRYVKNLKPGASFFIFDSQYSFMAGYDDSKDMGTVHVADRFLSPGKKFFTWGRNDSGKAWQKNLTDADGDYIEIMTGCFSDNQPDFTWIMPYETKSFAQRWYPLSGIRDLKNATAYGAVGVWEEEGGIVVGFNVTSPGRVRLIVNDAATIYDAVPLRLYRQAVPGVSSADDVKVSLLDDSGKVLVAWKKLPMFFDGREAPKPREKALPPEKIESVDALFVNGMHLEQYKNPVLKAEDYYREGLRRDPGDLRCNVAMGILSLRKGEPEEAAQFLTQAVGRATSRNPNPIDAECYYQLGLAYRELSADEPDGLEGYRGKALSALKRAAWSYAWKSAALQQAAELELSAGDMDQAEKDLTVSLETNAHSLRTHALRRAIWVRTERKDRARAAAEAMLSYDPMDASSLFTLCLCDGLTDEESVRRLQENLGGKVTAWLCLAEPYLASGLYEEGIGALSLCPRETVMTCLYRAWALGRLGRNEERAAMIRRAEEAPMDDVFPNSLFDRIVLRALSETTDSAVAPYYLGCMLYAHDNGEAAANSFQLAALRRPEFADAHRALAQVLFECLHDTGAAKSELARAYALSREPRIFYELFQLTKVAGAPEDVLLALLENNRDMVEKRQDLRMQYIERLCRAGRLDEAIGLLSGNQFYSYEGGEGVLPGLHAFAYIARGLARLKKNDTEGAMEDFQYADEYPPQYHEGAKYGECRAHIHYFKAVGFDAAGRTAQAQEEFRAAASQNDCLGVSQLFKGLAMRRLGHFAEEAKLFLNLKEEAKKRLADDALTYFLTFPAALPYEQSQQRAIDQAGYAALFFAQLGLGETEDAAKTAQQMRSRRIDTYWVEWLSDNRDASFLA